jgi:hypothetical protein
MTFDDLWKTLPIPVGYSAMDEVDQRRWKAVVEASFRRGVFNGAEQWAEQRGYCDTADSKRISDLEAAVAEIQAVVGNKMLAKNMFGRVVPRDLEDLGVGTVGEALKKSKEMQSALKVIHTWCCFPESFMFEETKSLCRRALGREE